MHCPWVNQMGKGHLVNPAQPLVIRVSDDIEYQRVINSDETIYGIINNFASEWHLSGCCFFVKALLKAGKTTIAALKKLNLNPLQKKEDDRFVAKQISTTCRIINRNYKL